MSSLQLKVLSNISSLEEIRRDWSRLWGQCPDATPFQSPEWLLPWWKQLGGGQLLTMALWRDQELVGLAPLFIHEWQGRRQVSPLGVSISDYTEFLLLPEVAITGSNIVFECLAQQSTEWDICILPEVRQDSPLLRASAGGLNRQLEPSEVCPVLTLPGTVEAFQAGLTGHLRRNLRRSRRLLESMGGGDIEIAKADTLSEFTDALFQLHEARWKEQDTPGVLAGPPVQAFHREVIDGFFRNGILRLYALRQAGRIASVMYDMGAHDRVYAYLGGFDLALERVSPGALLTYHAIEQAIQSGCREYDLLRGREEHKYMWGAVDRQNYRLVYSSA